MLLHIFPNFVKRLEVIKIFECLRSASKLVINSELSACLGQVLQGL